MAALSPISGKLSDRYGSREIAALGMGLIGAAFVMLLLLNIRYAIYIAISLMVLGIGFGIFSAPNTNSVMGSVTPKHGGIKPINDLVSHLNSLINRPNLIMGILEEIRNS